MNGATHIDMSLAAAELVGWKGDQKRLAREAASPDAVRTVLIEGYGAFVIGKNCAAFAHFNRRRMGSTGFVNVGYNWGMDRSLPKLDLLERKVTSDPMGWGFPLDDKTRAMEPLHTLIETLTNPETKGDTRADRITFPAAAIMAEWCEKVILDIPKNATIAPEMKQQAIDTVTGWALHFVEDCCVPHHAEGLLLKGHSAFEGDIEDVWRDTHGAKTWEKTGAEWTDGFPKEELRSLRTICEDNALKSQCSPGKLGWYRWFWRRGWNRLVNESILRGFRSAVQALRRVQALQR